MEAAQALDYRSHITCGILLKKKRVEKNGALSKTSINFTRIRFLGIQDWSFLKMIWTVSQASQVFEIWYSLLSISKFDRFKNLSAMDLVTWFKTQRANQILLVQMKSPISTSYRSSTSSEKPWRSMRLNPAFRMRIVHINSNMYHSQKLEADWKFSNRTSLVCSKDNPS